MVLNCPARSSARSPAIYIFCLCITSPFVLSFEEDTCGGPRAVLRDRLNEADGYIPPGQQVTFADVSHEFTGCGRISQWSMVFKCAAASREDGYPLELQVFQAQGTRQSILIGKNQVTLTNEQCERQLASFNVSLPFCDGDYAGIYMPDAAGISGLGYRDTENLENAFYVRAISAPLAVRQKIALSSSDLQQGALPLVSVEAANCVVDSIGPPPKVQIPAKPVPTPSTTASSDSAAINMQYIYSSVSMTQQSEALSSSSTTASITEGLQTLSSATTTNQQSQILRSSTIIGRQSQTTSTSAAQEQTTTSKTQKAWTPAVTPLSILHPAVIQYTTSATSITDSTRSTIVTLSFPTASPEGGFDAQFGTTIMDSETVAAVVSAMLFLATLTVIVIAGVLGAVFIYRKKVKTKTDSVYAAETSCTVLRAPENIYIEAVYSVVGNGYSEVDGSTPIQDELPDATHRPPTYQFEGEEGFIFEEEEFLKRDPVVAIHQTLSDQEDQCREMETKTQCSANTKYS